MDVRFRQDGDVTIMEFHGRADQPPSERLAAKTARALMRGGSERTRRICCDLRELESSTPQVAELLHRLSETVSRLGGRLVVARPRPGVDLALAQGHRRPGDRGLPDALLVFPSLEEALRFLRDRGGEEPGAAVSR